MPNPPKPSHQIHKISGYSTPSSGGVVKPLYSERQMKCYTVTESELHQLTLANSLMALAFSAASACLVFAVDVKKDILMGGVATDSIESTANFLQLMSFGLCAIFFVGGAIAYVWRRGMVSVIKKESGDGTQS